MKYTFTAQAPGGFWDALDVESLKRESSLEEWRQQYQCEWPPQEAAE